MRRIVDGCPCRGVETALDGSGPGGGETHGGCPGAARPRQAPRAVDLLLTWSSLSLGAAEINPLMHYLLALQPASAAAAKLGIIAAASLAIWWFRRFRTVLAIAVCLSAFYCFVVLYELVGFVSLL
jgi:hypothetical protein